MRTGSSYLIIILCIAVFISASSLPFELFFFFLLLPVMIDVKEETAAAEENQIDHTLKMIEELLRNYDFPYKVVDSSSEFFTGSIYIFMDNSNGRNIRDAYLHVDYSDFRFLLMHNNTVLYDQSLSDFFFNKERFCQSSLNNLNYRLVYMNMRKNS